MKSLENTLFKGNYRYKVKFVNKCIKIIRYSGKESRIRAYKNLLFKMMKDIVKKNIGNYINLLRNTEVKYVPTRDELVSECYLVFDKCVSGFLMDGNCNFYFYFNKSLSRNFYRLYQKEVARSNSHVEVTEVLEIVNSGFHDNSEPDTMELLMSTLNFDELDKRICRSKLLGEKCSEFLKKNSDVNKVEYSNSVKKIRLILNKHMEEMK